MNKTDLVNAIAEKANLTKVDAKNALDACLEAIAGALENNDKVALSVSVLSLSVKRQPVPESTPALKKQSTFRHVKLLSLSRVPRSLISSINRELLFIC